MPRIQDLKKVLILGSGPIVIGQACEFDYSGTQACKALMAEGLEVILVNSNPATIMTDPEIATRVYIEPLTTDSLAKILEIERPQAVIPTLGGQTALNLALELHAKGILQKYGSKLLGATPEVIRSGEDREIFRNLLDGIKASYPKSILVRTFDQGWSAGAELGFPLILRPNYTLGGGGGGIAYSPEDYQTMLLQALHESPTSEVLIEESILGWYEYELEVMRDHKGSIVIVCSIENIDPCGVHTGDSITVAPQLTLSDDEYQEMRDESCKIINAVGIQTGGANIQFAVHPTTRKRVVIEMNPRVSRSSALASKATGFPIAKIAALLAIGYALDEITNDITKVTPSCYEPALDYVVTKVPRFAFEKFHGAKDSLTTQMKSVGEAMGIGRTLSESLMKALSSMEMNSEGIPDVVFDKAKLAMPNSMRIYHIFQAFRQGMSLDEIQLLTGIHPFFLTTMQKVVLQEKELKLQSLKDPVALIKSKRIGFSDARIGKLIGSTPEEVRKARHDLKIRPGYFQVDTCAGEFLSETPYFYSTYWSTFRSELKIKDPVAVIGSGPNRIGQGIEFDYSCVRGVKALRARKIPVVMINSNPETVSTDYDTSDALFFEPLTSEYLIEIMDYVKPRGFIAQLGGQTPLNSAKKLVQAGHPLLGSSLETIDLAEDRAQFAKVCTELNFQIPKACMVANLEEALKEIENIPYPVICRPSYVLGGRRMEVIESEEDMRAYFEKHGEVFSAKNPCLMDQFLSGALEVDVEIVRGTSGGFVGGIVEHIEAAGVHSGDSMGVLPPQRLKDDTCEKIESMSLQLADRMKVIGHLNLQLAVKNDEVYILEANPRSSRSLPFVCKATGLPLVDYGISAMLGDKLQTPETWKPNDVSVKGVVFPFKKFPEADLILGPEMKSTGESMGRAPSYSEALKKAFITSQVKLPKTGLVFFSLRDKDKDQMLALAKDLQRHGYGISATTGTAKYFNAEGVACLALKKVDEGRPHCVDKIRTGEVALVINTTSGRRAIEASFAIRRACIDLNVPCLTESNTVEAFILALKNSHVDSKPYPVISKKEIHGSAFGQKS